MPPLRLRRGGLIIHHGTADEPLFLFREIFLEHSYDRRNFYVPRSSDTVLDLGANIGMFMLYLQARARGIHVHCFEPATAARHQLEKNVADNSLQAFVSVYGMAVTDRNGDVELNDSQVSGHRSMFASEFVDASKRETVRAITLDGAVTMSGTEIVDLLKVDVEGAEVEILEGAHFRVWRAVKRVVLEFHDRIRDGCGDRCLRVLKEFFPYTEITTFPPHLKDGVIWASREAF